MQNLESLAIRLFTLCRDKCWVFSVCGLQLTPPSAISPVSTRLTPLNHIVDEHSPFRWVSLSWPSATSY